MISTRLARMRPRLLLGWFCPVAVSLVIIAGCGNGADTTASTPSAVLTTSAATPKMAPSGQPTRSSPPPTISVGVGTATSTHTTNESAPLPTTTSPTWTPTPTPTPAGTVLITGTSAYGPMLFDARGQAIYLFEPETEGTAECYDACAIAWPPVLTDGAPVASDGVEQSLLGTTPRSDGATQVTYAGHPLYFYAHETPNEVRCHNVVENGGLWLIVTPGGDGGPH